MNNNNQYNNIPSSLFKWDAFKNELSCKYVDYEKNKTIEEMTSGIKNVISTEKIIGKDGFERLKVTYAENKNYAKKDSELYLAILLYKNDYDGDKKVKKYVRKIAELMPEDKRLSDKRVSQLLNCLHDNGLIKRHTAEKVKGANTYELMDNIDNGYVTVYDDIFKNPNLSISDVILYLRLLYISYNRDNCIKINYNVTELSKALRIGRQRFYKLLNVLVTENIVSVVDGDIVFDLQNTYNTINANKKAEKDEEQKEINKTVKSKINKEKTIKEVEVKVINETKLIKSKSSLPFWDDIDENYL